MPMLCSNPVYTQVPSKFSKVLFSSASAQITKINVSFPKFPNAIHQVTSHLIECNMMQREICFWSTMCALPCYCGVRCVYVRELGPGGCYKNSQLGIPSWMNISLQFSYFSHENNRRYVAQLYPPLSWVLLLR